MTSQQVSAYIEFLLGQRLTPKTINCRLDSVRGFFNYLSQEEGTPRPNPVQKGSVLRVARSLPRYLKDEEVTRLFSRIKNGRDRAIFKIAESVPISALRQNFRDKKYIQTSITD